MERKKARSLIESKLAFLWGEIYCRRDIFSQIIQKATLEKGSKEMLFLF